ncbi:MAG: 4-(cytidine 5'-diphospho)-2-C-methyl-D-erythritol kinase, partial [Actinomycetota bacterium]
MAEAISEPAPAKLNVFLRVLGAREDGYHDLETLIQPITLADGVRVETSETGLSLTLAGEVTGVPDDGENLVLKAAAALSATCGRKTGA